MLFLALSLLGTGCGATLTGLGVGAAVIFGGDGTDQVRTNAPATVFALPAERSVPRAVTLTTSVADAESDPVALLVEYGRIADLAGPSPATFTAARLASTAPDPLSSPEATAGTISPDHTGLVTGLSSSPSGHVHTVVWDATTGDLPPGVFFVEVRYTVVDPSTLEPLSAPIVFRETIGNDPPSATLEIPPGSGPGGALRDLATIGFRLSDSTADVCRVRIEYALATSPTAFFDAEISVGATRLLPSAETLPAAPLRTVAWRTSAPPPGGVGNTNVPRVIVRLTPIDVTEAIDPSRATGAPVTAAATISNNSLPAVRPDAFNAYRDAGSPIPIAYTLFDQESDPIDLLIEVRVGDGPFGPATERPAGAGAIELSEGGRDLASGSFPTGVRHRFLWDMRADVPDEGGELRMRFVPRDPFGVGLPVEIGPIPVELEPPFIVEPGRDPGTTELVAGVLDHAFRFPSLVGVVGGRVTIQEIDAPGITGGGDGFLERIEAHDDFAGGPIEGCDAVRIFTVEEFFGPVAGLIAVNRAAPFTRFTVYSGPLYFPGSPRFEAISSPPPPLDAVSIADLLVLDADDDEQDDIAVLYRVEDSGTHGWRLWVYPFAGFSGTLQDPVELASVLGLSGSFDTFEDVRGSLAAVDLDGDGERDLIAAFRSSGFVSPDIGYLVVATNERASGGAFSDVRVLEDPELVIASAGSRGEIDGVVAGDLDGDGAPEIVVSTSDLIFDVLRRCRAYSATSSALTRVDREAPGIGLGSVRARADLDGDGRAELICANSGTGASTIGVDVLRLVTTPSGRDLLADATPLALGATLTEAIAADLDEDGAEDLALLLEPVIPGSRSLHVLWNDGRGGLGERQVVRSVFDMARLLAVDLENDGDLDLVAPHPSASNALRNPRPLGFRGIEVVPFDGDVGLEKYSFFGAGDLDGDGRAEVVVRAASSFTLLSVAATADGTIAPPVTVSPQPVGFPFAFQRLREGASGRESVALIDDGLSATGEARLVSGGAAGAGAQPTLGAPSGVTASVSILALDVNGDGRDDLVSLEGANQGGPGNEVRVALRLSGGSFSPSATVVAGAPATPFDAVTGDLDGDGAMDLAVSLADDATILVLRGIAGGAAVTAAAPMTRVATIELPENVFFRAMAMGDVTGDGRADLAVVTGFGVLAYVQGADGRFDAPPLDAGQPNGSFYAYDIARAATLDVDGDGRREVLIGTIGFDFDDFQDELAIATASVAPDGSFSIVKARLRTGAPGGVPGVGDAIVTDLDGDGRAEALFPIAGHGFLLASPKASGGRTLRQILQLEPAVVRVADVTGEGRPDLVVLTPQDDLLVGATIERRRTAAARLVRASTGGAVTAVAAPIAGARVVVPPGARRADRTIALLPGRPLDPPAVSGTAVVAGVADEVFAPASPPLAILPETETLTADATISLPLDLRAPALASLALANDATLAPLVHVFRFEREARGGRGQVVEVPGPFTVATDAASGARVVTLTARRFGVYQAAIAR